MSINHRPNHLPQVIVDMRKDADHRLASLDSRGSVLAVVGRSLGDRLRLRAGLGALELLADGLDAGGASTGDGGSSTEVGVDASEDLAIVGLDVLDDDGAGDGVLAVTACPVELAEVDSGCGRISCCHRHVVLGILTEAVNGDSALAVVLNDLVRSSLSSSTPDRSIAISLEG
jgi:hypothetical protein